ncbi:hypothetical protein BH23CHL4_BH23CHL4_19980 [soil metagenome]
MRAIVANSARALIYAGEEFGNGSLVNKHRLCARTSPKLMMMRRARLPATRASPVMTR